MGHGNDQRDVCERCRRIADQGCRFRRRDDCFAGKHVIVVERLVGWGTTWQNPTGAIKDAIDQGKAIAMWSADRGDIYITW
jgi:hypothetical protein